MAKKLFRSMQGYLHATLLLSTLLLSCVAAFPVRPAGAQSSLQPQNPYGVNLFLHKEVEEAKIERTLKMVADANIPWIKQEFPWQEIEFKKGYFYDDKWGKSSWEKFDRIMDLADKYHLNVIARVDHAPEWARSTDGKAPLNSNKDLADMINSLLDHYKGRIKYVQVWNEPNLEAEWVPGTAVNPASYAAMLKEVYPAVKTAHPGAVILSAPMAMTLESPAARGNMNEIDYWNGIYSAGVKGNFDIASANGYGLDQPPDAPPSSKVLNFRRVELLRDIMVKNGDAAKSIWFDEYGWNASPESLPEAEKNYWRHVTPEQQAQWTVEGVEYARQHWPWAGVISIWYFRQVGDISPEKAEYYFGMVDPDFVPQPVYKAVQADASKYPGPVIARPASTITPRPATPTRTPRPATSTRPPSPTRQPSATATAQPPTPTNTPEPSPTVADTATPAAQATSTPTFQATTQPTLQPTSSPTAIATVAAHTATPFAVATEVAGTSTKPQDSSTGLLAVGGLLVAGGLAALAFYFARGKIGGIVGR